jgi:hypothetical protein
VDPLAQLKLLKHLLHLARPGALYPDARRISEWLMLCVSPRAPRIDVDGASGFPSRKSLERLVERQALARAVFQAHRARPARNAAQFHGALAAAELWAPGCEVKLMWTEGKQSRLMVVHDRFGPKGCPTRFTLQLVQAAGARHVRVERGEVAHPAELFRLAIEEACDDDASVAALRLIQLQGIAVSEVVRGVLGPLHLSGAEDGFLELSLERVGDTVEHGEPVLPGLKLSRELKWVCTPPLEAGLRARAKGTPTIVRSR